MFKKHKIKAKKNKRKITQEEILEEQYKGLIAKQENLKLKKRKLELEVSLWEQKVCSLVTNLPHLNSGSKIMGKTNKRVKFSLFN